MAKKLAKRVTSHAKKTGLNQTRHDEDKLLLFTTGIVFALGLANLFSGVTLYSVHAFAAVITMLGMIEKRQLY